MGRYCVALLAFIGFVLMLGLAGASDQESRVAARYQASRVHLMLAVESSE